MFEGMATRTRNGLAAARRHRPQYDEDFDPQELSDLEESVLDKLRMERARRAHLDFYDYIELQGF